MVGDGAATNVAMKVDGLKEARLDRRWVVAYSVAGTSSNKSYISRGSWLVTRDP